MEISHSKFKCESVQEFKLSHCHFCKYYLETSMPSPFWFPFSLHVEPFEPFSYCDPCHYFFFFILSAADACTCV